MYKHIQVIRLTPPLVNVLITLGSERLYSDLSRKFSTRTSGDPSESVFVIRIDKSGGCVDRSEEYMKTLRHSQIKEYFFGKGEETLAPSSQMADAADLNIFRVIEGDVNGGVDEYGMTVERQIFEKVIPSEAMQNQLLAITTASPNDPQAVIRDSSIKGYIYVADVDEAKKKVKLLSPLPGATPGNAMILGNWPETVEGLVN
jgi:polyribonucleotide 5'-hydroxyl-kinase